MLCYNLIKNNISRIVARFDGIARPQRIEHGDGQEITRGEENGAQRAKERSKEGIEVTKEEERTDCTKCISWDPAEEECSLSEMLEYDEEGFYRLCAESRAGE